MRALYLDNNECCLNDNEGIVKITGKPFQHLVNVVRIKKEECVLIFDGQGRIIETIVSIIQKKEAICKIKNIQKKERSFFIDLAFGIVKREALESIIKVGGEVGLNKIIPIRSDFSQSSFIKKERIDRLCESALIQSNNPFLPIINDITFLNKIDFNYYDEIFYFSSNPNINLNKKLESSSFSKKLIILGPEGGFSEKEEKFFQEKTEACKCFYSINLPTPILRTPTAIGMAMGFILGKGA